MKSTVKISSPNGIGNGSQVLIDGVAVPNVTDVDVSIGVGHANVVRLHLIAQAQDIGIEAEVKIAGTVFPPAVELALLAYLDKKYADRALVETTNMDSESRSFHRAQPAEPAA